MGSPGDPLAARAGRRQATGGVRSARRCCGGVAEPRRRHVEDRGVIQAGGRIVGWAGGALRRSEPGRRPAGRRIDTQARRLRDLGTRQHRLLRAECDQARGEGGVGESPVAVEPAGSSGPTHAAFDADGNATERGHSSTAPLRGEVAFLPAQGSWQLTPHPVRREAPDGGRAATGAAREWRSHDDLVAPVDGRLEIGANSDGVEQAGRGTVARAADCSANRVQGGLTSLRCGRRALAVWRSQRDRRGREGARGQQLADNIPR